VLWQAYGLSFSSHYLKRLDGEKKQRKVMYLRNLRDTGNLENFHCTSQATALTAGLIAYFLSTMDLSVRNVQANQVPVAFKKFVIA
jgi:hypothetical protein